jgi:hypothetical protein
MISIGAHVYGGSLNSASVIGRFGNPYSDYLAAFKLPLPNSGLQLIPVTGNAAINAPVPSGFEGSLPKSMILPSNATAPQTVARRVQNPNPAAYHRANKESINGVFSKHTDSLVKASHDSVDEGFFDVLKTVARVGAPILGSAFKTGLPLVLGPAGAPIGALAGIALGQAGKLCESAEAESASADGQIIHEGVVERAVLAEAVLTALQSTELSPEAEESIFSDMKDTVMKALPTVKKVAPKVIGAMMEPALRIALDSLHKYNAQPGAESFEDEVEQFHPKTLYTHAIDQPADARTEAFLHHLKASMRVHGQESSMDEDSQESFGDFLSAGLRLAGKGLTTAAKFGLPILARSLGGAESVEAESGSESSHLISADVLAQRALVADAALQAVMKLPPQHLEEEGFFGFLGDVIKKVAPVVVKAAPHVLNAAGSIVSGIVGQESAMVGESTSARRRIGEHPKLRSQRSLAALRQKQDNGSANHFNSSGFSQTGFRPSNGYPQRIY